MTPILCWVVPVQAGGEPTHPIAPGGPPPGIWPSPGYPAHPIAPGGPPPGIWPSPGHPAHPIAPGGSVDIWPFPGQPTHPIVLPPEGLPPGIWHPILTPEHPIYLPITPPPESGLKPEHPIYIPVYPSHPIANVPTWEDIKDFIFGNPPARPHPESNK